MEAPIRIEAGVRLFVLDDGGVLFSAPIQELSILNASATLVWCCLEEGNTLPGLVETYGQRFALDPAVASGHVHQALAQWQGLGLISGFTVPPHLEQPVEQALGRLLINESLRAVFGTDPQGTAARLGVRRDEVAEFVTLDPRALERQARLLRERQSLVRGDSGASRNDVFCAQLPGGAGRRCAWVRARYLVSLPRMPCWRNARRRSRTVSIARSRSCGGSATSRR